jgi:hypothetical protein
LEVSSCRIVDPKNKELFFVQRGANRFEVIWKWVETLGEAQIITTCEVVAEIVDKKKTTLLPPKRTKRV